MGIVTVNSLVINSTSGAAGYGPFHSNRNITSIDLGYAPWTNNSMYNAFYSCYNLTSVTNINIGVTNMYRTFQRCYKLYPAPVIPNSVTSMHTTFIECKNLTTPPIIPNAVTDMYMTFYLCANLTSAPIIPNSVMDMYGTFQECSNLTGNIFIESNKVSRAASCFFSTTLPKNVYIPFTYSNGVNTQTYNSFISAGYKTDGSVHGVYLKDIGIL